MGSNSLKDYLKRYESNPEEDKKKKKKKKKKSLPQATGLLVVDEDPAWQKPIDIGENEENSSDGEKPVVDEDIEVKRMKRLEQLKARRPYHAISEDGSGWIPLSSKSDNPSDSNNDMSPLRKKRVRYDSPSPEPESNPSTSIRMGADLSPLRRQLKRNDTPSPEHDLQPALSERLDSDLSPVRKHRRGRRDLSPDLSPQRKSQRSVARSDLSDISHRRSTTPSVKTVSHPSLDRDLSPPRKNPKELSIPASVNERKTGLISGKDIKEEIERKKKDDMLRFKQMDPVISGRGAEPVFRDNKGVRITKEEYLKSKQKVEEKPKEIEIEWGKGLAQKREAEARLKELEVEKDKPFARTRDDPELDKLLKERVRWGDPMAHLVKKKYPEPVLPNLGDNEKMKESGFVVPQDIPDHSWLKRGLDAAPNRYGIRPGRHWDGVDRSNGFEKGMFKRSNERQAKDKEAYLWSVSDM
ncbi:uncharacterized protein [Cicer arietinum]|uniref:BUD13 homolog n=1 Tax=Cicer arietinum TaxID=3827 RepID=A0A1S2YVZ3_CICAR|nr:BUD13 homolog [Cicer arietinum]